MFSLSQAVSVGMVGKQAVQWLSRSRAGHPCHSGMKENATATAVVNTVMFGFSKSSLSFSPHGSLRLPGTEIQRLLPFFPTTTSWCTKVRKNTY